MNSLSNFKQLDYPVFDKVLDDLNNLLDKNIIQWNKNNQICINSTVDQPYNYHLGCGSLTHDWTNKVQIVNSEIITPIIENQMKESDFTILCEQFKNTQIEKIYKFITDKYSVGRIRLMKSIPKTCLTWHRDWEQRLHYVLLTHDGCFMVIKNEIMHMPTNTWWLTNTLEKHTAFNGSKNIRIHLVASLQQL